MPRESLRAGCEDQGTKSGWALPDVAKEMSAGASNHPWEVCQVAGAWLTREAVPSVIWMTSLIEHHWMVYLLFYIENAECYSMGWLAVVKKLDTPVGSECLQSY